VIDAIIYILHQWDEYSEIGVDDLMKLSKAGFSTGGIIVLEDARNELVSAYATGRGRLMVRGRVHLEDMGKGRSRLIITEIPYQVNKRD
jgi:DNA gyrase subunit A